MQYMSTPYDFKTLTTPETIENTMNTTGIYILSNITKHYILCRQSKTTTNSNVKGTTQESSTNVDVAPTLGVFFTHPLRCQRYRRCSLGQGKPCWEHGSFCDTNPNNALVFWGKSFKRLPYICRLFDFPQSRYSNITGKSRLICSDTRCSWSMLIGFIDQEITWHCCICPTFSVQASTKSEFLESFFFQKARAFKSAFFFSLGLLHPFYGCLHVVPEMI